MAESQKSIIEQSIADYEKYLDHAREAALEATVIAELLLLYDEQETTKSQLTRRRGENG